MTNEDRQAWNETERVLRHLARVQPPEGMNQRVLARLRDAEQARALAGRRLTMGWLAPVAAAVAAVFVAVVALQWNNHRHAQAGGSIAEKAATMGSPSIHGVTRTAAPLAMDSPHPAAATQAHRQSQRGFAVVSYSAPGATEVRETTGTSNPVADDSASGEANEPDVVSQTTVPGESIPALEKAGVPGHPLPAFAIGSVPGHPLPRFDIAAAPGHSLPTFAQAINPGDQP